MFLTWAFWNLVSVHIHSFVFERSHLGRDFPLYLGIFLRVFKYIYLGMYVVHEISCSPMPRTIRLVHTKSHNFEYSEGYTEEDNLARSNINEKVCTP